MSEHTRDAPKDLVQGAQSVFLNIKIGGFVAAGLVSFLMITFRYFV